MAYKKTFWKDRIVEKPNTYKQINNPDGTITLQPVFGQVIEQGTPFNAASLNKIEDGILDVYKHINLGGNFRIFKTIRERDKETNVEDGMICYVNEEGVYYARKNDEWEIFKSGSGGDGGTSIGTLTSTCDGKTMSVSVGETLEVDLFFSTPNVGAGTVYVTSNDKKIQEKTISMGSNKLQLNLAKGSHKIEIYATDRAGVFTNIIQFTVQCGGLEISTNFDWKKDYSVGTIITFPYTIDTISKDSITTHFKIGNETYKTESEKNYNEYILPKLNAGIYKIEVWATSGKFESNKIVNTLSIANSDGLFVASLFDKKEAEESDQLIIDYRVSMKGIDKFNVVYYVNGQVHRTGTALNGDNAFVISSLKKGPNTIKIEVTTLDGKHTAYTEIAINVIESSYEMKKPITQGLLAWFDAYELNNQDPEKEIWKDKSEKGCIGKLHNFNYATNGWIKDGLKMNGNAYVELNVKPFLNDAEGGLTIDIEFETEDVGDENARVLDCTTATSSGIGCYIDTNKAYITSNKHELKSPFAQNERTRVTYVIDRINKLAKVYINAILCEVVFLGDQGNGNNTVLESFKHDQCIYLNSRKGQDSFGDCTIYSVRVYGRALNSKDILQNHIADIKDKTLQKEKWDFNYNNTMPTMYFTGNVDEMTKEKAVELQIEYVSTDEQKYGASFNLPKCSVKWQGTSSLEYAVKNYKIKLIDAEGNKVKRSLRGDMIPESTFVLKADYMESSHANNTGCAKIVNEYLYDKDKKLPPQETNDKVVSAIVGFPIKLVINGESMGIFNFNLDKGNEDSFGFNKENKKCISYEVRANTDTTAGAFHKWDETKVTDKVPDELAYLKKDFELRFPDDKKYPDYGYMDELKRLVNWVSDASDKQFREEFDQYLNKEYTFKYYLFILAVGMVDNCGKNMMLCTWDGNIWFPCFYDLDTCLGLDNSGYLKFDVDIEMEPKTYNTSNSKLWTKVRRVFKDELAQMYRDMRASTFKEENLFNILIGEQIDKIPESLYNEDSERKYIKHPQYLHMLHGSRREHMRKWINERLLYLDSQFGYEKNTRESIIIRANKKGRVELKIKTYSPMFVKVRWRNDDSSTELKKVGRNEIVSFVGDLPTETDQEIAIYGAKHIKEIGDISDMKPSSLTLGNATRLTKIECRNSPNLKAIGLGGTASEDGGRLKNLQLIDLTGCSKLGQDTSSAELNVSYCDNLKTLKLQGTNLQSIAFNIAGGNLEELYLPNSITSLHLANQYSLKTVKFPNFPDGRMTHRNCYDNGSKIVNLTISNCVNLTHFGADTSSLDFNTLLNYRGIAINSQSKDFDISQAEYKQAYGLGILGRLESLNIDNALLNYKYLNINASPSLQNISFNNMPELKGLILTGNKTYGASGGNSSYNLDKTPNFNSLNVNECPNFDTLILQKLSDWQGFGHAYKFKNNFTLDLSHLKLKRFICNLALQNVKKIILPSSIKEFSHSETKLSGSGWSASDGSSCAYATTDSPLETIIIAGQPIDDTFKGIDLSNIPLKNVNLNGLTQKVDIMKNVNCEAIDLIPVMTSPHYTGQKFESILINLNNYKGTSLASLFKNMDMENVRVTLDNPLNTKNMDYSSMFINAKNVLWENIQWIKNLPKGKVQQTFSQCDVDRLEVGHMVGNVTSDLQYCFANMPNITYLDVTGADTSSVTNGLSAFGKNGKLQQIVGLDDLDFSKVTNAQHCFANNPVLTNVPVQIISKFTSLSLLTEIFVNTPLYGTDKTINIPDSVTFIENLFGVLYKVDKDKIIDTLTFEFGTKSKLDYIATLGDMQYPVKHIKFVNMPKVSTCHCLLSGNGPGAETPTTIQSITGLNIKRKDRSYTPLAYHWGPSGFYYPSFTTLTFEGEIDCRELYLANLRYISAQSLVQIIEQLKDKTGDETTGVLNVGTENMKKLTQDMIEMAQNKNWSVIV